MVVSTNFRIAFKAKWRPHQTRGNVSLFTSSVNMAASWSATDLHPRGHRSFRSLDLRMSMVLDSRTRGQTYNTLTQRLRELHHDSTSRSPSEARVLERGCL